MVDSSVESVRVLSQSAWRRYSDAAACRRSVRRLLKSDTRRAVQARPGSQSRSCNRASPRCVPSLVAGRLAPNRRGMRSAACPRTRIRTVPSWVLSGRRCRTRVVSSFGRAAERHPTATREYPALSSALSPLMPMSPRHPRATPRMRKHPTPSEAATVSSLTSPGIDLTAGRCGTRPLTLLASLGCSLASRRQDDERRHPVRLCLDCAVMCLDCALEPTSGNTGAVHGTRWVHRIEGARTREIRWRGAAAQCCRHPPGNPDGGRR